jgi:hypothetical protein
MPPNNSQQSKIDLMMLIMCVISETSWEPDYYQQSILVESGSGLGQYGFFEVLGHAGGIICRGELGLIHL